jgi:hypothetical protein
MDIYRVEITTAADGTATAKTPRVNGYLCGVEVVLGTATAVDVTVADAQGVTLYTKATLNANGLHVPLIQPELTDGAAMTFDGTRKVGVPQPVVGALTVTIANGGNAKTASIIVFVDAR